MIVWQNIERRTQPSVTVRDHLPKTLNMILRPESPLPQDRHHPEDSSRGQRMVPDDLASGDHEVGNQTRETGPSEGEKEGLRHSAAAQEDICSTGDRIAVTASLLVERRCPNGCGRNLRLGTGAPTAQNFTLVSRFGKSPGPIVGGWLRQCTALGARAPASASLQRMIHRALTHLLRERAQSVFVEDTADTLCVNTQQHTEEREAAAGEGQEGTAAEIQGEKQGVDGTAPTEEHG